MKLVREYLYERFEERTDPLADMEIGGIQLVREWLKDHGIGDWSLKEFRLNNKGEIDTKGGVYLRKIPNLPDFIQFGEVDYNFVIENSPEFTSLRGIPRKVKGDFKFLNNGIKPTEEQIRKLCDVEGYVMLIHERDYMKQKQREKYRELGPVSKRPSPRIDYAGRHLQQEYSRGYHLWKVLEFIESERVYGGATYSDIVAFDDKFRGEKKPRRTLSSGMFDAVKRYIDKNKREQTHRYFLNSAGESYLRRYKEAFRGK